MKSTSDRASTSRQATGDTMAIVTAWLATNRMNANEVPGFIRSVHEAVIEISGVTQPAVTERGPVRAAPAKAAGRGKADRPAPKKAETRSKPAPARKETKAEAPEVRSAGNGHDVVPPLPRKLERKLSRVQLPEGFQRAQTPEDVDRIVAETVHPDGIICVLDGVKKRMLKRHVRAAWGLEWEEYLTLVGLPEDYPSACSNLLEEKRMAALESIGGEKMKQARERASRRRRRDAARGGAEGEAQSDRRAA